MTTYDSNVYFSDLWNVSELGDDTGLKEKYQDIGWYEPSKVGAVIPQRSLEPGKRYMKGEVLARTDFPEASCVEDPRHFAKQKELFLAGGFLVVREPLTSVLASAGLGAGGLISYTIYEADKTTPLDERFHLLNFGGPKRTFLPEESENVDDVVFSERLGASIFDIKASATDDDIVVSGAALEGADIWVDDTVMSRMFLKGSLVRAMEAAGCGLDWRLTRCRVVGGVAR